jgi:bifunctional non-homologous end joining protein LigD
LLGVPDQDELRYVGKVGTGFSAAVREALLKDLRPLALPHSPFRSPLPAREAAAAHFARPVLVGEVAYGEWTTAGRLRHPTWRGLRPDKVPDDVVVE